MNIFKPNKLFRKKKKKESAQAQQSLSKIDQTTKPKSKLQPAKGPKDMSVVSVSNNFSLRLANDLCHVEGGPSHKLLATGSDPHFIVENDKLERAMLGWHCVYLHIDGRVGSHNAKFYADFGSGYSEDDAYVIQYTSGKPVTQILHFPRDVLTLRFDPQEIEGPFDLISFQIAPLTEKVATEVMLSVLEVTDKFISSPVDDIGDHFETKAEKLKAPLSSVVYQAYLEEVTPARGYGMSGVSYWEWMEIVEKQSLHSAEQIGNNLATWKILPKISVIIPTYNTGEKYLRLCIDSVVSQSYPNWELCIADDCSTEPQVKVVLDEYASKNNKIKVVYRKENGHISKASNSALEFVEGEYVALLDHDDALAKDALYHVVEAINNQPEAEIIYTDEDWTDAKGTRIRPHFKSDWNPELLYSHNYVTHLCVYRKALIDSVGGFRTGVEGSQDYDLLLRCSSKVDNNNIVHIPRILYHWRAIEGSTALSADEKGYSDDAGLAALSHYFETEYLGQAKVVNSKTPNMYKVEWAVPEPNPLVSLLMPTRDQKKVTERAVRSILDLSTYTNFELIIIDNGSEKQETLDFFEAIQQEDTRVKVVRYDEEFNYPAINNFGFRHAKGEIIGLINNDVEVITPEWLTEMVSQAARPDIGCVGAKLYYENDTIQHAGVILGIGGVAGHSHRMCSRNDTGYVGRLLVRQNFSAVTAACLLVDRRIYEEVGGLDEENLAVAFNDVDFCLKVREAGYRNVWTPFAELYHYESISRGYEDTPEKVERFERESAFMKKKWGKVLNTDPYYNPNLTVNREDFSFDAG